MSIEEESIACFRHSICINCYQCACDTFVVSQLRKDSVLVKFADVFHTTYTHQELDIMFTFGRCVLIGQFVRSYMVISQICMPTY